MESVFEAFISNPALYRAGHLVGETLHFPTNTEEVQSLLKRIGVDGVRCQEYFIIS
ncbi:antirestriction protein ArdA, partial [Faecalibacterium sp. DFI.5.82]|uniref:antirestriction protein ArdA n=1 Tax=Faecalibacterium sp. DFI.5.82 TaxID=3031725 RepID=UPI0023AFA9C5